jgi:hypothetical protein
MVRLVTAAFGAAFCLLAGFPAQAQNADERALRAAFGRCGEPCVIKSSPGGEVKTFQADGPCFSACAIFADLARSKVCVTSRARFGFHKATLMAVLSSEDGSGKRLEYLGRQDPPHSSDIAGWVQSKGGFPRKGFRTMSAAQAGQFFKRC